MSDLDIQSAVERVLAQQQQERRDAERRHPSGSGCAACGVGFSDGWYQLYGLGELCAVCADQVAGDPLDMFRVRCLLRLLGEPKRVPMFESDPAVQAGHHLRFFVESKQAPSPNDHPWDHLSYGQAVDGWDLGALRAAYRQAQQPEPEAYETAAPCEVCGVADQWVRVPVRVETRDLYGHGLSQSPTAIEEICHPAHLECAACYRRELAALYSSSEARLSDRIARVGRLAVEQPA